MEEHETAVTAITVPKVKLLRKWRLLVCGETLIMGLTKSIAREYSGRNINCNAIAPGRV